VKGFPGYSEHKVQLPDGKSVSIWLPKALSQAEVLSVLKQTAVRIARDGLKRGA